MNAAQHQQSFNTIGEVNARLSELGFSQISANTAMEIQQKVPKQRFITALEKASSDAGARQFLQNLLGMAQGDNASAPPSSAPSAANGPAHNNPSNRAPEPEETSPAPAPEPTPGGGDSRSNPEQEREYIQHHCYGSKAALCWEADTTRNGLPTVALDAALATAPKQYNWAQKVRIQLTRQEMPQVTAVLLGYSQHFRGSNHGTGDQKGKAFEISHQGDKVYVKVFGPNRESLAVPIFIDDLYDVAGIFVRQLQQAKPWMSAQEIILLIQSTVGRLAHNANQKNN